MIDFKTANNESLQETFLLSPENIARSLFAPYGNRRECIAGQRCRGVVDFADEYKTPLMQFQPDHIEQEFKMSGKHSVKESFCVLCIIYLTAAGYVFYFYCFYFALYYFYFALYCFYFALYCFYIIFILLLYCFTLFLFILE